MAVYEKSTFNIAIRSKVALGLCLLCFSVLIVRLWYLQIIQGEAFRIQSENNRWKTVFIPPPRGLIYDRHGEVLVRNKPAFNVELVVEDSPDAKSTVRELAVLVGQDPEQLVKRFRSQRQRRRYEPQIVLKNVSRDVVAQVTARASFLPGVLINTYPARDYVHGDLASHVLGYIREISKDELASPRYDGYRIGDLVGKFGLEKQWERHLQGKRGRQNIIVNAQGVRIRTDEPSLQPEIPGHSLKLTLDFDTQLAADTQLIGKRGSVVAVVPQTGEILAMSSSPAFNPNIFTGEVSAAQWSELVAGKDKPLNNRAVQGAYPPGSVFKGIMGVAGLAEGVITPGETIYCPGYLRFGNRSYRCHKRSGHGAVNLSDAIKVSCDVYFYTVGQRLGVDRIHDYATRFGLGSPTGLGLVQEHPGLVPSTAWKKKRFAGTPESKWYPGETLSVAIGQGALLATPLQMALGVSALVNGGIVYKPLMVKEIFSDAGSFRDSEFAPSIQKRIDVDEKILERVKEAFVRVVNATGGTGGRAKLPPELNVEVGGKTGTSQVVSLANVDKDDRFQHHAWFVGFAPAEKPEIVVATIVENGGHGGVAAAPVVSKVMEAYFRKKLGIPVETAVNGSQTKEGAE